MAEKEETDEEFLARYEAEEKKAREEFEKLPPEEQEKIRYEMSLLQDSWDEIPY